jgi:hypothetical protein
MYGVSCSLIMTVSFRPLTVKYIGLSILWHTLIAIDSSPSETTWSTVHRICEDPNFQQHLGNTVGEELVPDVCRLFNHYAEKLEVIHGSHEEDMDSAGNSDQEVITPAVQNNASIGIGTYLNEMTGEHSAPTQGMHIRNAGTNKNWDPATSLYYDNYAPRPMSVYFPHIPRLASSSGRQPHSDSGFGTHHSMDHSGTPQGMFTFGSNLQDPSGAGGDEIAKNIFPFNFVPTNTGIYTAPDSVLAPNLWTTNNTNPDVRPYKNSFRERGNGGGSEHSYEHQEGSRWSANAETSQWSNNSGGQGPFGSSHQHGFEDAA